MGYDIPSDHSSPPRRASDTGDAPFEPADPTAPPLPPRHTIAEAAIHHHAKMICFYYAELVTMGFGRNEAMDIIKADSVPW